MSRSGTVRIGISGWTYGGWRGSFYPSGLQHSDELSYASRHFDTIEINGTHYSLQRPDSFARWRDETPDGFVFAVKGSRFITHMKQLRDVATPLANFFAQGVLRLEEKLGPLLWQFAPRFRFNEEKLDAFFSLLPRDTEAAAALAERHDHRLADRAWTRTEKRRPLRHAIEIRHPSRGGRLERIEDRRQRLRQRPGLRRGDRAVHRGIGHRLHCRADPVSVLDWRQPQVDRHLAPRRRNVPVQVPQQLSVAGPGQFEQSVGQRQRLTVDAAVRYIGRHMGALWRPAGGIAGVALGPGTAARWWRVIGLDPGRPRRSRRWIGGRRVGDLRRVDQLRIFHRFSST